MENTAGSNTLEALENPIPTLILERILLTCDWCGWIYLTVTEVDELGLLPAGPDEFILKQLAIKVHPRAAVLPGNRLPACVIGEQSHVHAAHEQSSQLDSPRVQVVNLWKQNMKNF